MRTYRRRRAFGSPHVVARTLMAFLRIASDEHFAVLAYCFMPDHLHALLEGTNAASDLRAFVQVFERRSERMHASLFGSPLWQEGYHDRVLRPGDDPRLVARYILDNPVRAGLATTPRAYPHLGSGVWSIDELISR